MMLCAGKMGGRALKSKNTIQVDSEKCIGCRLCGNDCPTSNILIEEKKAWTIFVC